MVKGHGQRKTRKGTVLIVWGTPGEDLAKEVQRLLTKEGFDAQIGGSPKDATHRDNDVGPEVRKQLRGASRAIILAQPEQSRSSDPTDSPLRPRQNVVFEWGFLSARLPPEYIHVFLIGLTESHLPSDLAGAWHQKIALNSLSTMAAQIVEHFVSKVQEADAKPLEAFKNWPAWKARIDAHIDKEEVLEEVRLAGMLLHSIQPAFYTGEISELSEKIRHFSEDATPQIQDACRLVNAVCEFYDKTGHLLDSVPERRSLDSRTIDDFVVRFDFVPHRRIDRSSRFFVWFEIIRNDFLGLACVERYRGKPDDSTYLDRAEAAYREAKRRLEKLQQHVEEAQQLSHICKLWQGYVRRNLGIVFELKSEECAKTSHQSGGDAINAKSLSEKHTTTAKMHSEAALGFRREIYEAFRGLTFRPPHFHSLFLAQINLEVLLTEIDLYRTDPERKGNIRGFDELMEHLERSRPEERSRGIWNLLLARAVNAASSLEGELNCEPLHRMIEAAHAEIKKRDDEITGAEKLLPRRSSQTGDKPA